MGNWVTDVRHCAAAEATEVPAAAQRRAAFSREVVEAATSRSTREPWRSAVRCVGQLGRRNCSGRIEVERAATERVSWSCAACGDTGVITGFEGGELDLSSYHPPGKMVCWGVDDEERKVLASATTQLHGLRAVIARARPHAQVEGLLLVEATVRELDELYTLVEELTDGTRSRSRVELLDGLRASLCTSMDGF